MKLYFYFLDTPYKEEPKMRLAECEVIERAKTYKPADVFPTGYHNNYVKKEDLNQILQFSGRLKYISVIRDDEKAKAAFRKYLKITIAGFEKDIAFCESQIKAVENFGI